MYFEKLLFIAELFIMATAATITDLMDGNVSRDAILHIFVLLDVAVTKLADD